MGGELIELVSDSESEPEQRVISSFKHLLLKGSKGKLSGKSIRLVDGAVIGRSENPQGSVQNRSLLLADNGVSRRHCMVVKGDGEWMLQDLGSLNKTLLNRKPVSSSPSRGLRVGDVVRINANEFTLGICECLECSSTKEDLTKEDLAKDKCMVCSKPLDGVSIVEREIHINECLDAELSEKKAQKSVLSDVQIPAWTTTPPSSLHSKCFVCSLDLSAFSLEEQTIHINSCLDKNAVSNKKRMMYKKKEKTETGLIAKTRPFVPKRPSTACQLEKRIKFVDERIVDLKSYRKELEKDLEKAKQLENMEKPKDIAEAMFANVDEEIRENKQNVKKGSLWDITSACANGAQLTPSKFRTKVLAEKKLEQMSDDQLGTALEQYGMKPGNRTFMLLELAKITNQKVNIPKQDALNVAVCEAITKTLANEALYEDILLHKCVDLDSVQATLRETGVKVGRKKLATILDSHGVTYKYGV
uniref:Structure-specific endonuclease subunit SLX4 n=1 Tax=Mucochytrium quahogii TaxID=96639 RepID=A0A7S2S6P4_9STRA|mmetsp:Transcript_44273/g.70776  ORF Transcript_44273/g.70776 Transcript_44273/m.70776 type:complete len:473 (+) Transcript_44273:457-1875(+)